MMEHFAPMSGSQSERKPGRVFDQEMPTHVTTSASVEASIERGLNETRLAVIGIVVAIGLTVGIGFDSTWWIGLAAGLGSLVFSCFLIRFRPTQRRLVSFMHWLTGS